MSYQVKNSCRKYGSGVMAEERKVVILERSQPCPMEENCHDYCRIENMSFSAE
jgi:hypothetical protein